MRTTRTILTVLLAAASLSALACEPVGRSPKTIEPQQPAAPVTTTQPAEQQPVMVRVNGQPVYMAVLHEALVEDFGKPIAQQLIASEVVRQQLAAKGLPTEVTEVQVRNETMRAMNQIFNFEDKPTWEQAENLLGQFLRQRGLTRRIWDETMRRNAQLARLAASEVEVTQEELIDEYHMKYGAKWRVRHIQVPNLDTAGDLLDQIEKGADFEKLAFEHSTNPDARKGAWLPEISPRVEQPAVPQTIAQAALAMRKPGEVSNPIQAGTNFHILKLEEIVPPEGTSFEDVRAELKPIVRDRKIAQMQQQLLQTLIAEAKIEYIDPTLREQLQRGDTND